MEAGPQQGRSIVELLAEDDSHMAALFERLTAERDSGHLLAYERLVGRMCETLAIQRLAEEDVLYPAIRPADDKLVFGFLLAGLAISMRIGEIRDPAKARAMRDACVVSLIGMVRRNMFERAQVLLPFTRARLLKTQLVWLGDSYVQRKAGLWGTAGATQNPRGGIRSEKAASRKVIPMPLLRRQRPSQDDAPLSPT